MGISFSFLLAVTELVFNFYNLSDRYVHAKLTKYWQLYGKMTTKSYKWRHIFSGEGPPDPSTPSLPIVGQNCWAPTNFQFFVGIGLPCLMLGQTSLPRVVTQQTDFLECWGDFPSLCWDWNNSKTSCHVLVHGLLPVFPSQQPAGKSPQHPRSSDCWATTLRGQVWQSNNRQESHPNNNFPKKSPFCWIPTHFYNLRKESASPRPPTPLWCTNCW